MSLPLIANMFSMTDGSNTGLTSYISSFVKTNPIISSVLAACTIGTGIWGAYDLCKSRSTPTLPTITVTTEVVRDDDLIDYLYIQIRPTDDPACVFDTKFFNKICEDIQEEFRKKIEQEFREGNESSAKYSSATVGKWVEERINRILDHRIHKAEFLTVDGEFEN